MPPSATWSVSTIRRRPSWNSSAPGPIVRLLTVTSWRMNTWAGTAGTIRALYVVPSGEPLFGYAGSEDQ